MLDLPLEVVPLGQPFRVTAVVTPLPFAPERHSDARAPLPVRVNRGGRLVTVGFEVLLRLRVWCRRHR